MIERMPRKLVPPLIASLRASAADSQYLSSCLRLTPGRLPCSQTRFYASPTLGDPKPLLPTDARIVHQEPHKLSYQQLPQDVNHSIPPEQPPPPKPRPKRSLRPYIYATIFFIIGATTGQYIRFVVVPPALPTPGTQEDAALTAHIHKLAAKLPIVRALDNDPDWHSWDAYSTFTHEERLHRITTGPLGGSRGLGGYQRIFHNASTGAFVSVVWLGGALAGWPGVVHGGLIATVLDENMGRCAIARFPAQTGMTANLDISYRAPAVTNAFYVVRAVPVAEGSTDRKGFVRGSLETTGGKVCVEAKGLFVLPKKLPLSGLKPTELKKLNEGF